MKNALTQILTLSFLSLIACGGGGGGGSSSGSTSNPGSPSEIDTTGGGDPSKNNPSISAAGSYPYPDIKADPYFVGDQIDFNGKRFTLTNNNGQSITFETQGRNDTYYLFADNLSSGGVRFNPIAMGNRYGLGVSTYIYESGLEEKDEWFFSLDGDWTENVPTSGGNRYFGEYESLDAQGNSNGIYPIRFDINFDDIQSSAGADLVTGEDVYIFFTDLDGTSLAGIIADQNSDQNTASFGLFGPSANTIIGGYASPLGNGLLIGEKK